MLNKWKCSYSPLLHLNLNAVMCKINSINLTVWGASRNHSWLVMQIKELRGFYCPTHFSQNFAVLPALEFSSSTAGYSLLWSRQSPGMWYALTLSLDSSSVTLQNKWRWQWQTQSFPQPAPELVWAQKPLRNGSPPENAHFPLPHCPSFVCTQFLYNELWTNQKDLLFHWFYNSA